VRNRRALGLFVLLLVLPFLVRQPPQAPQAARRFFRVDRHQGAWSFIDPEGRRFFSIGINVVNPTDEEAVAGPSYRGLDRHGGDLARWRVHTLGRLRRWRVNTIGAWSRLRGMPYVVELSLSYRWADVFGRPFEDSVRRSIRKALQRPDVSAGGVPLARDPLLIGYFTDNELAWGWGFAWSGEKGRLSLFEYYASLPPDAPGKKAWADYLTATYGGDWKRLSRVWNAVIAKASDLTRTRRLAPRSPEHQAEARRVADGFLRLVAERYFEIVDRVVRRFLPHHLNLGPRLTPGTPEEVIRVAARSADVLSINVYTRDLDQLGAELSRLFRLGGKPVLLTEFSFPARSNRSGNTNKGYERAEVRDDTERGAHYARCLELLGELPFVVGAHWFQYYDQPTLGRKDGESCNFGFVDVEDRVYEDLAGAASQANLRVSRRRSDQPGGISLRAKPEATR
jgi:hypothetical protein